MDDINLIYETYHLPEIEKDGLTEIEYNHRCKYLRLYIKLIERCKNMTPEELSEYNYTEEHHILPNSLGGTREKSNMVELPIRYHVMAHIILKEVYPDNYKVVFSAFMIMFGNEVKGKDGTIANFRKEIMEKKFSVRTISRIREDFIEKTKTDKDYLASRSGENCFWYGKHLPDDIKEKISKANKGHKVSEETREKLRQANLGKKHSEESKRKMGLKGDKHPNFGKHLSEEHKNKISKANKGRKLTEEQRKKWSEVKLGEKNSNYGKHLSEEQKNKISDTLKKKWEENREEMMKSVKIRERKSAFKAVVSPDGVIYQSVKEAVEKTGIPSTSLRNWMKGVRKNNPGWHYLDDNNSIPKKRINHKLV